MGRKGTVKVRVVIEGRVPIAEWAAVYDCRPTARAVRADAEDFMREAIMANQLGELFAMSDMQLLSGGLQLTGSNAPREDER